MATDSELGILRRLPYELRNQIYQYFVPQTPHAERDQHLKNSEKYSSNRDRSFINLMCTSRTLREEVSRLLYNGWKLMFITSYIRKHQNIYALNSNEPKTAVWLGHQQLGRFQLLPLEGPLSSLSAQTYRRMPHHRWKNVFITILFPESNDPGTMLLLWASMKLIVDVLELNSPDRLGIALKNPWRRVQEPTSIICPEVRDSYVGGDLGLLLLPLGRLLAEQVSVTLYAERGHEQMLSNHDRKLTNTNQNRVEPLLPLCIDVNCGQNDNYKSHICVLGNSAEQDRVDALLDDYHDFVPGKLARLMRKTRMARWNRYYENRMIHCIGMWPAERAQELIERFAERWVVWQALQRKIREDWRMFRVIADPSRVGQEVPDLFEKRDEIPKLPAHWNEVRWHDEEWERLKYSTDYFERRILVTMDGIEWGPFISDKSATSELVWTTKKILYDLWPPARRSPRPPPIPRDSRFYR